MMQDFLLLSSNIKYCEFQDMPSVKNAERSFCTILELYKDTVGFCYRKAGIATTPIVQVPTVAGWFHLFRYFLVLDKNPLCRVVPVGNVHDD